MHDKIELLYRQNIVEQQHKISLHFPVLGFPSLKVKTAQNGLCNIFSLSFLSSMVMRNFDVQTRDNKFDFNFERKKIKVINFINMHKK